MSLCVCWNFLHRICLAVPPQSKFSGHSIPSCLVLLKFSAFGTVRKNGLATASLRKCNVWASVASVLLQFKLFLAACKLKSVEIRKHSQNWWRSPHLHRSQVRKWDSTQFYLEQELWCAHLSGYKLFAPDFLTISALSDFITVSRFQSVFFWGWLGPRGNGRRKIEDLPFGHENERLKLRLMWRLV